LQVNMIRVLVSHEDDADTCHIHDARREPARVDEDALAADVDEQARVSEMSDPHNSGLRAPPPLPELFGQIRRSHTGQDKEVCRQGNPAVGETGDAEG
jgi:hypothetical protein